jgi:uncharacterized protein YwqG
MSGLFLYRHPDILRFHPRDCFPKNEISFVKYTDINHPFRTYTNNIESFSFWDDRKSERNNFISKSIDLNFGNYKVHDIHLDISTLIGRDKLPDRHVKHLEYKSNKIEKSPFSENWPQSWFHIEIFCSVLNQYINKDKKVEAVNNDYEFLQLFSSINNKWLKNARSETSNKSVPRTDALKFKKWVTDNYLSALNATPSTKSAFTTRFGIEEATTSFSFATNWLFDLTNSGHEVFTNDELKFINSYRKTSSHHPHQMLGYGEPNGNINYPEDTYQEDTSRDSVLLLQLSCDDTLMWGFGDLSTLQFKISKDALRKLKFEEATMELIM